MGKLIHVVGTDTGVGKTVVGTSLARGLKTRGIDVGVCKPFASGEDPSCLPSDAASLLDGAGVQDDHFLVAPVRFRTPASPWAASREEARDPGITEAREAVLRLGEAHEVLIVEGIGGIAVPLDTGITYLDFLAEHPGWIVLVARAGLGTLNHTFLSLEALRARGIEVSGVVLNRTGSSNDLTEASNLEAIETFGAVRVLADLPFLEGDAKLLELPVALFEVLGFS